MTSTASALFDRLGLAMSEMSPLWPKSGGIADIAARRIRAMNGLMHRSKARA
jgi:hypothetical protein